MNLKYMAIAAALFAPAFLISCQDDVGTQGSSLVSGEVAITVDSIPTHIEAQTVDNTQYDSRAITKLLGRINVPEYGELDCSFVTQLYPSPSLGIPDSIQAEAVDSMRMVLSVPRGSATGDSLAPQQLQVFRLDRQLPADIDNTFSPEGYYSASGLLGTKSYTLSAIAKSDSAFKATSVIQVPVNMPKEMALDCFNRYRNDPSVFQWPSTFAKEFPGIYVRQNFGNGCVAAISGLQFFLYWHRPELRYVKDTDSDDYVYKPFTVRDSVCLFSSLPEVLSSNIIDYNVSQTIDRLVAEGKSVVTTPGGRMVKIKFPAQEIIDLYNEKQTSLREISSLSMMIPAQPVENDYGIDAVPYLLMVKSSEMEDFFNKNKLPDGVTSFYAPYDSDKKAYSFSTMRQYILNLINSSEPITDEDVDFSLVPVLISTETVDGYSSSTTYVTHCANYIGRPTMTVLDTDKTIIAFTFSRQQID